ncbi:MAG: transposase [Proteobacteria bacterium]|nr:transposase [Pseudomonadota bacterium]
MLSPKTVCKNELKDLYKNRWHVELDLRNIKTTLGMEILSCKTPDMIEKEIVVYLLAHNLIRIIMAEAASRSNILPRQLSFKHSLQLWRTWRQQPNSFTDYESLNVLLLLIIENTVGHRSGRVEPRAVKRWRKSYPLLTKPRSELRAAIRTHGHPEK